AFRALPEVFKPMAVSGWSAVIHFELSGGDDWTVRIEAGGCEVEKGKHGDATCVVKSSLEDYAKVLAGELRAEQAFMQKKISASNLGEMMKFGRAFDLPKLKDRLTASAASAPAASGASASSGMNRACVGRRFDGR
ncbi:MAG TPA: hypothetical protein DEA08_25740, partial [Planctomycetes bacterium]|nr:hypothetical protein [Planctomycetota bacterium]